MCYSFTLNHYRFFAKKAVQILIIILLFVQPGFANFKPMVFTDPSLRISLFSKSFNAPNVFTDEVVLDFANTYSNGIDINDVAKTNYSTDNLAILNSGYQLSAEKRKPISTTDTIRLLLSNTRIADYSFQILPSLLEPNNNIQAFIKDKYLLTETQVSFITVTNINFSITADAGSKAADRFYIFFRPSIPAGPLSVTFLTMAAMNNADETTTINWTVAIEVNLKHYQTEKATNPNNFTQFGTDILPIGGGNAASYIKKDKNPAKGINYYRIKATSQNGQINYSNIVKLDVMEKNNSVVVFPNPSTGHSITLRFNDLAGKYQYSVLNSAGQVLQNGNMQIAKALVEKNILFTTKLLAGMYRLQMINEYGKNYTIGFSIH